MTHITAQARWFVGSKTVIIIGALVKWPSSTPQMNATSKKKENIFNRDVLTFGVVHKRALAT